MNINPKLLPRKKEFRYTAVGSCIYCGSNSDDLTDEHIIAYGLNGNFVLPKSSCKPCATITSKDEIAVLRGFLDDGRKALGISSRKKHKKTYAKKTLNLIKDEIEFQKERSDDEDFQVMHLPVFINPIILNPDFTKYKDGITIFAIDTIHIGNPSTTITKNNATGINFKTIIDVNSFARMLAKIALSYYAAEKGTFPKSENLLIDLIMRKNTKLGQFIGCIDTDPLITNNKTALHLLAIKDLYYPDGHVLSIVRIRLFASNGGPTYIAAVRLQTPK